MWPRVVECMLGIWLVMSPFIFRHPSDASAMWINDLGVGLALIVLSLASYARWTRWAHWLLIPVAVWLMAFGRFSSSPPLVAGLQNDIIVGLLLALVAIIPNDASRPPVGWVTDGDTPDQ
jgi:hypothetical protein